MIQLETFPCFYIMEIEPVIDGRVNAGPNEPGLGYVSRVGAPNTIYVVDLSMKTVRRHSHCEFGDCKLAWRR